MDNQELGNRISQSFSNLKIVVFIRNIINGRNGPNDNSKNESLREQQETARNLPCEIHINKTTEIISPDGTRQTRTKEFHKLLKGKSSERREWEEKEAISASITRPDGSREVQLHEKYQDHTMELPSEMHSHVYDED
ncbi:unnamed protein product [Clavelina lepadiformis]|uniref:Uncharacterized protein n=1 Tax=Clavelina lepadiformis TaxID=159417 RepID=A0ABP0GKK7_CLALP